MLKPFLEEVVVRSGNMQKKISGNGTSGVNCIYQGEEK